MIPTYDSPAPVHFDLTDDDAIRPAEGIIYGVLIVAGFCAVTALAFKAVALVVGAFQ
jgi:hypothetical protein